MIPPLAIGAGLGLIALALLKRKTARGGPPSGASTGWYGSDYTQYGYPGFRGGMGPGPGYGPWGGYGTPGYSELGYGHGYYINRYGAAGAYGAYGPYVGAMAAAPSVAMPDALQGVRNLAATYLGNLQASNEYPGPTKDALMHQLSMIVDPNSTRASITSTLAAMRSSGDAQASLANDLQAQLR
jgi:hypothetical protein